MLGLPQVKSNNSQGKKKCELYYNSNFKENQYVRNNTSIFKFPPRFIFPYTVSAQYGRCIHGFI